MFLNVDWWDMCLKYLTLYLNTPCIVRNIILNNSFNYWENYNYCRLTEIWPLLIDWCSLFLVYADLSWIDV